MKKTILCLCLFVNLMLADSNKFFLTEKQVNNLNYIIKNSEQYKNIINPYLMAAISFTESGGKKFLVTDKKPNEPVTAGSIGPMQIRLDTIRYISMYENHKYLENLSDYDLVRNLFNDMDFSIKMTATYFKINKSRFNSTDVAISLHNGGVRNYKYVAAVKENLKMIMDLKKAKVLI